MALTTIEHGALAKSSVLNDNFVYLDEKISKSAQTLEAKINMATNASATVTNGLATTQTTVNAIQDDLSALTTTTEGKASKDLSDVTITTSFGAKIAEVIAPNLTAGYSISSGWKSPNAGWVYANRSGDNFHAYLYVDGKELMKAGSGGSYSSLNYGSMIFIGKNRTVTFDKFNCTFYPSKGV